MTVSAIRQSAHFWVPRTPAALSSAFIKSNSTSKGDQRATRGLLGLQILLQLADLVLLTLELLLTRFELGFSSLG